MMDDRGAAEKLKALDAELLGSPWDYDWNAPQNVLASDGSGKHVGRIPNPTAKQLIALRNALPQIVAVVELAEGIAQTDAPVWGTRDGLGFKLQNALAALDEALT